MSTTIQVSNTTKQMLEQLKKKEHAKSYDEIIVDLMKKHTKLPESMFGALKGKGWVKEDRLELREF